MPLALVIRIALRALARNTLCSLLTTLGIKWVDINFYIFTLSQKQ